VSVVLCPRSNAHLGVGVPPLPALLAAGVRLALGTDSLASAPDLDVLEDARALRASFPDVPARILVDMATSGGAQALGIGDLGAIAPGRRARLAYAPAPEVPPDPFAFVLAPGVRTRGVQA
jgi:cytosine/adenosine deaminase-related metal-dependent hydrolase